MLEEFAAKKESAEAAETCMPTEEGGTEATASSDGDVFQVRRIDFLGEEVPILLQNRNGPCALLAIANGLLLRGAWNLGQRETSISSRDLLGRLGFLCDELNFKAMQEDFTLAQKVRDVISSLPKLLDGLLVNCDFGACGSFEDSSSRGLFELFRLQLFHVWVDLEVHKVVPTWNDLMDLLANSAELRAEDRRAFSEEEEETLTKAALLEEWLEANRAQATQRGILELQKQVKTGDICVLFRNNHFCTVYKPGHNSPCPHCCMLLTDECFSDESSPVWETLVFGEGQFLDAQFCSMESEAEDAKSAWPRLDKRRDAPRVILDSGGRPPHRWAFRRKNTGIYNCNCGKYFSTLNGYIIRDDGSRVDLRWVNKDLRSQIELQYGWRVERHMVDGDYVIFNRQPSLHKMSMMGHRAKVMPFSTLRFNLAVTSPYNADFDGDEMNLHLAQSHETRAEIKHMMLNPRQVVSPQGNKPVMGVVQDSLLATAKYTKRDTYMEKDLVMNILMWLPVWDGQLPTPAILKPKPLWTGKQILSMLLPKTLSMKRDAAIATKNKKDEPDFAASDCKVLIVNGELLSGIICKKTIGSSSGSLLHLVWLDSGPEWCRNVLSYIQKMVNQWLTHNGFSCGVADIIANDQTLLNVEKTLKQAKNEVRNILADAQRGKLETQPGKTMYQSFEARVNQRLNAAREDAGNIGGSSLDERNNIISMVNAGSKGSPLNIAQIVACVGQQNVEGARIRYGFNDRTLPHFTKDDYGAEARGFVENSYLAGLTPQEVWMHAMGGREGVIDTACKTSETGYIQRRLVKSMETLKVAYDGTARNACNDIIQFLYGEDGMDGLWIEDQTLDIMTYDHKKLESSFQHKYREPDYGLDWLAPEVVRKIQEDVGLQKVLDDEWQRLKETKDQICKEVFPDGDVKQHIPINITRLLDRSRQRIHTEDGSSADDRYTPVEVVERVEKLLQELEVTRAIAEGDTIGREVEDNAKVILNAHLRCALASKKILQKEQLSKQSFDWLLGEVKQKFMKSLAHPGEVIGTLAAQSVGEPATQMTLNTFHFAGVGAKNVTLGVPRLKELINVAKKVKTPSLAVFLSGDLGQDQARAKDVQSMLEHTTLEKVTSFTQIFWDPDPEHTLVEEDKEWVSLYYELPDEDENPERCGPWLLRIQLSNKVMTDKKLTVREVGERILRDFMNDLDCIFTDDNAEELVLRIRLLKEADQVGAVGAQVLCAADVAPVTVAPAAVLDEMLGAAPTTVDPDAPPPPLPPGLFPPTVAPPAIVPNAPACASDLTSLIFTVTVIAKYIIWSTQYCSQPNEVSTICANYATGIVKSFATLAVYLSSTVFNCGNIQAVCSQTIAGAISGIIAAVQLTMIMEITCFDDVLCAYLAVRFVSALLHAAKNVDTAVMNCNLDDDEDDSRRRLLEAPMEVSLRGRGILPPSAYGLE
ncbi:unnamed protein product [Durusdinium trenchii]|uniref:DNA-directed RNA polymerase n=1 Tax=Durusdinium trenchii TaxID=1381693 RepID=A0ABP0LWE6_9DINO